VSRLDDQSIGEFAGCLVGWFNSGSGGTLGETVGASVGCLLHSWLFEVLGWLDGELVAVLVDK
jgi:uncharacterized membrane protein YeaQ/YmgE (transglycosylase-associated protein family)